MIEGHQINNKQEQQQEAATPVPTAVGGTKSDTSAGTAAAVTPTAATCCCPVFDTTRYNENVQVTWNEKLFLQESVWTFLYIPLTFGRATRRALTKIEQAHAQVSLNEDLLLDDFISPWRSNIYFAISKPVPHAKMTKISGTFVTKTFEGPYHKCGEWMQDTKAFVREKTGKDPLKVYAHYSTCPKCAQEYGKNYVVMFAQIA
jgi:hypothetical protein